MPCIRSLEFRAPLLTASQCCSAYIKEPPVQRSSMAKRRFKWMEASTAGSTGNQHLLEVLRKGGRLGRWGHHKLASVGLQGAFVI